MSTVNLTSSRFGRLEIPRDAVLEFPNGLIGLGGRRYALISREEDSAFIWLHSLDDGELAIPVTNPWRFFAEYEVELSDNEAERIGIEDSEATSVYVTVRSGETAEDFFANLAAPILISGNVGHQVINQAPDAPVRAPLFAAVAGKSDQDSAAA